jgi:hypothetical protein
VLPRTRERKEKYLLQKIEKLTSIGVSGPTVAKMYVTNKII